MPETTIGWIGTGVMGSSMCHQLLEEKYPLFIYNRTRSKADSLIEKGAVWCDSPAEVARNAHYIFTIVGYPEDVEQVVLGEDGILQAAAPGTYLIDMTTSTPELAIQIYQEAKNLKIHSLDAPVSGGDVGAKNATLAVMVGGEDAVFDEVRPLLGLMGENIVHMGGPGKGQHTKMANQILVAGTMIGVVESLLYAKKMDLDLEQVISVIGKGAAASWSINHLGRRIAKNDFEPGFFIRHFVKDMRIALDEARRCKLALPGLALAEQFYTAAMAQGLSSLGTQGLYKVLEQMNSIETLDPS